jgi:hypothetical protein
MRNRRFMPAVAVTRSIATELRRSLWHMRLFYLTACRTLRFSSLSLYVNASLLCSSFSLMTESQYP